MRPRTILETHGRAIGFDIGGSTVRSGLVAVEGGRWTLLAERREALEPAGKAPDVLIATVARHVGELSAEVGAAPGALPVGVGLCAQVTRDGRRAVNAPNLGWREVDVADRLEAALPGAPIKVDNDLNVILLGEHAFGAARGHDDVVAVYPGTGIGGAVLLEGRLWRGSHGFAGEIGHIGWGGEVACGCGGRGCSETLAGGAYIEARVAADRRAGKTPPDWAEPGRRLRVDDVDRAFTRGDPYAVALWGEVIDVLATVAATAVTLLDVGLLLLGGGVVEHCPALTEAVAAATRRRCPAALGTVLQVAVGQLGAAAGILGAAAMAMDHGGRARASVI